METKEITNIKAIIKSWNHVKLNANNANDRNDNFSNATILILISFLLYLHLSVAATFSDGDCIWDFHRMKMFQSAKYFCFVINLAKQMEKIEKKSTKWKEDVLPCNQVKEGSIIGQNHDFRLFIFYSISSHLTKRKYFHAVLKLHFVKHIIYPPIGLETVLKFIFFFLSSKLNSVLQLYVTITERNSLIIMKNYEFRIIFSIL